MQYGTCLGVDDDQVALGEELARFISASIRKVGHG
jgi:hypothetical protein